MLVKGGHEAVDLMVCVGGRGVMTGHLDRIDVHHAVLCEVDVTITIQVVLLVARADAAREHRRDKRLIVPDRHVGQD